MKLHRKIIRRQEVLKRTGNATSTLYEKIQKGIFPKPVKLGPRAVGWIEDEVDAHVEKLIEARDSAKSPTPSVAASLPTTETKRGTLRKAQTTVRARIGENSYADHSSNHNAPASSSHKSNGEE